MNSLVFMIVSMAVLAAGYKYYGGAFSRLLGVDPNRTTPAHTKHDSVDYVPAKHWLVLFGHHFSSIAGAGPIVGPVIAVSMWGWGPSVLFILLGTIFLGGVHDLGSLFVSIREDGSSIAHVAEELISRKAKVILSWFVFLSLVVVVAVFTYFCANTFVVEPKIVVPSLGLIFVAMLAGYMMYRLHIHIAVTTVVGLLLLVALLFMGQFVPIAIRGEAGLAFWCALLLVYCFFASVLPVNLLLQPRDYLSSYLLYFGIGAGMAGVITSRPGFTTPAFMRWGSAEGPLWPMLFVTIACGAISGFHSLVSSGTTSKQISSERDAKKIGYGAMVVEALMAVIAVIAVAGGFTGADFLRASIARGGPVEAFGAGYGFITRFVLGDYGKFIAILILNAFILTTLDTATRIGRYIIQELFMGMDKMAATAIIVILSGWIAMTGEWAKIWPVFGSANQLIAALTLLVVTIWLLANSRSAKFTLIPAIFMLVTTIGALLWQLRHFAARREFILMAIDIALIFLSVGVLIEIGEWAMKRRREKRCQGA